MAYIAAQLTDIFNSCEHPMDEMNPTEDIVTITVKSSNGDEQYTLDRKNRVVEDLRKKGLPIGRLMFGNEVINGGYTGEELGI